ncbi:hypothetical protein ENUP19_0065G0001 [Entamoeba nuttalli]|uniref:Leucine rich repeat protein, BspA family protein n=1 Tax=Entamoeba nuttalli TaxID=412467 RepID=A0ABQ0DE46_9EUKA
MQIGYNEIMIVSKYFDDINDFINLEIGIKRFRGNMERFHFNPIPLNQYSRRLFPNIETFHIYKEEDEIFEDGRIFKYVIWYKVSYSTYLEEKEEMNEYKNIEYTQEDRKKYGNTIPIEVTSLGNRCFYGCNIQSIEIPTNVSEIGNYCFYECTSLISINIPTSVSKIGNYCFYGCKSLTSINIPPSISEIGDYCFEECSSLTSITIPTSVSEIGHGCFYECTSLISINIPTSVSEIGDDCFDRCYSLKSINIPTSVTEIGDGCFYECSSLTLINIPSSVTSFGYKCFYGCGCEEELKKNKTIPEECFEEY